MIGTRRLGSLLLVVLLPLGLNACSDEEPTGSGEPSTATQPSFSASPTVPAETPEPAPAQAPDVPRARNTPAGQIAFAQHVVRAWTYALNTNDPRPMLSLSPDEHPCEGCAQLARELLNRKREGWHVDLAEVLVDSTHVKGARGDATARMSISIPESFSYNADGSYRNTNQAHPRATFTVQMRFTKRGFRLLSFTVGT
jgi:hypothetical protein